VGSPAARAWRTRWRRRASSRSADIAVAAPRGARSLRGGLHSEEPRLRHYVELLSDDSTSRFRRAFGPTVLAGPSATSWRGRVASKARRCRNRGQARRPRFLVMRGTVCPWLSQPRTTPDQNRDLSSAGPARRPATVGYEWNCRLQQVSPDQANRLLPAAARQCLVEYQRPLMADALSRTDRIRPLA
jgi:hypothetical protein